jgi:hypothetical protein
MRSACSSTKFLSTSATAWFGSLEQLRRRELVRPRREADDPGDRLGARPAPACSPARVGRRRQRHLDRRARSGSRAISGLFAASSGFLPARLVAAALLAGACRGRGATRARGSARGRRPRRRSAARLTADVGRSRARRSGLAPALRRGRSRRLELASTDRPAFASVDLSLLLARARLVSRCGAGDDDLRAGPRGRARACDSCAARPRGRRPPAASPPAASARRASCGPTLRLRRLVLLPPPRPPRALPLRRTVRSSSTSLLARGRLPRKPSMRPSRPPHRYAPRATVPRPTRRARPRRGARPTAGSRRTGRRTAARARSGTCRRESNRPRPTSPSTSPVRPPAVRPWVRYSGKVTCSSTHPAMVGSGEAEALAGADLHRLAEQGLDAEAEHAEHQQVRAHAERRVQGAGDQAADGAHERCRCRTGTSTDRRPSARRSRAARCRGTRPTVAARPGNGRRALARRARTLERSRFLGIFP